jgi:DNA-binding MarR family transcriptional regulator
MMSVRTTNPDHVDSHSLIARDCSARLSLRPSSSPPGRSTVRGGPGSQIPPSSSPHSVAQSLGAWPLMAPASVNGWICRVDDGGHRQAWTGRGRATGGANAGQVTAEEVDWLIAHLQAIVATSPAVWAGRGMTLLQLTALHIISALAPVTLTDLAHALGTKPPATSAMVDRLTHAGLVSNTPDTQGHRRVQLTLTTAAEPITGDTDPDTARRLHTVLTGISPQTRHLIGILIDTI